MRSKGLKGNGWFVISPSDIQHQTFSFRNLQSDFQLLPANNNIYLNLLYCFLLFIQILNYFKTNKNSI